MVRRRKAHAVNPGKLPYRTHNTAYYGWIAKQTASCVRILDVGCGDGTLARFLSRPGRAVTGIDPSADCIARAQSGADDPLVRFAVSAFETYEAEDGAFDGIVFAASLHHMDMGSALAKAKRLLAPGGVLAVVGLASPSSPGDRLADAFRVVPAALGTALHRMRTEETLGIPVSYAFPPMAEVRRLAGELLPGAKIRRGLYWRYLLRWRKG